MGCHEKPLITVDRLGFTINEERIRIFEMVKWSGKLLVRDAIVCTHILPLSTIQYLSIQYKQFIQDLPKRRKPRYDVTRSLTLRLKTILLIRVNRGKFAVSAW